MYGKIFEQIYNSTVCQDWKTLIVFQQCIILSDDLGILDMTHEAISRRTNIPLEIIKHGIADLERPDPRSRSTKSEGRRLERMDEHRDWGWVVVNKVEYRKLASRLEKQNNDRERIAKKRSDNKDVAPCRKPSHHVVNVAHTDTDTDTKKILMSGKPDDAIQILLFLNEKTGRQYRPVKANLELIKQRIKEGYEPKDLRQVIAMKCREWLHDDVMNKYLRPATLFNRTKFAQYTGELRKVD